MARPFQDCAIMLGDSLTQMQATPRALHQRLTQAYKRKLDVLNRGFGGWNSNGITVLLDEIFAKKEDASKSPVVRLVTIWLGTNDSVHPIKDRTVPLPQFSANLNQIIEALTSPTSPYAVADTPVSIILVTPGPCLPSMFEDYTVKWRTVENTRRYRDAVLDVGKEWKEKQKQREESERGGRGWAIETVDFWSDLVETAGGEGEELRPYLTDGVHFTSEGYDVVWKGVSEVIKTKFIGRGLNYEDEEDLPERVPWCGAVDWTRPESILGMMRYPQFRLN